MKSADRGMEKLFIVLTILTAMAMAVLAFPDGAVSVLVAAILAFFSIAILRGAVSDENRRVLTDIFLAALSARLAFGLFVHVFELRDFFGGDANTFDSLGYLILEYWRGNVTATEPSLLRATIGAGYGINYFVAGIYSVFGRNILLAQTICAVIGAATAPMTFLLAHKIYGNNNVARISGYLVALFPAFIIWSGQLLKDGLVVFLLVLSILMVLKLQERFSYFAVVVLIVAVSSILTIRFYIFYMVVLAAVGSFVVGLGTTGQSILRRSMALLLLGVGLTYFGVIRTASIDLETYGDLERIERSRSDLVNRAGSGFGEELDVSTTSGAIEAIPVGFAYLMFGPFPWQMGSVRAAIVAPELLVWWAIFPLGVWGIWYTLKNRLRPALPALVFTLMLTVAYSIFQGNVGTAYRQRTQIQVFLMIFIAVGWTLLKERRENQRILQQRRAVQPFGVEDGQTGIIQGS